MAKTKAGPHTPTPETASVHFIIKNISESCFILLLMAMLFVFVSLITCKVSNSVMTNAGGSIGAYVADWLFLQAGYLAYLLPLCLIYLAWVTLMNFLFRRVVYKPVLTRSIGLLIFICSGCSLLALQISHAPSGGMYHSGGVAGQSIVIALLRALNIQGVTVLMFTLFPIGLAWLAGLSVVRITELTGHYFWVLVRIVSGGNMFARSKSVPGNQQVNNPSTELIELIRVKKEKIFPEEMSETLLEVDISKS